VTCTRGDCTNPKRTRGLCERHYRQLLRMDRAGYVPAERAREHVQALRTLGWTYVQIAERAGTSTWVPHRAATGQTRWLWMDREAALLSVPLEPRASHRGVESTGTRRRVQALAWMGWPCREVASRADTTQRSLATLILPHRRISFALAQRVADVYADLSGTRGPSKTAAGKARGAGFAPPLAWDEDTIDDPAAVPNFGEVERGAVVVDEEAKHLLGFGISRHEVARRLSVSEERIRRVERLGGAA
jgi:hypothetical protein